jgi:hypothetical protein
MNAHFSFKGKDVAYLLHGQEFSLDIQAESCWFVLINYNSGAGLNWSVHRPLTRFNSIANAQYPTIRVWGIRWGINLLLNKVLNINTLRITEQKVFVMQSHPKIKIGRPHRFSLKQIASTLPMIKTQNTIFKIPSTSSTKTNHTITVNLN